VTARTLRLHTSWAAKPQPESQKLLSRIQAALHERDFFTGRTGGREDETEARILGCALPPANPAGALPTAASGFLKENIFGFGPPKTKMRSRLPASSRPPVLPVNLRHSNGAVRTRAARSARAEWPFDATVVSARDLRRGSPRCDESLAARPSRRRSFACACYEPRSRLARRCMARVCSRLAQDLLRPSD